MKTSLVISIALFAVFTISEISCSENCVQFNDRCIEDSDCCSKNCYMSSHINNRVCMRPKNETDVVKVEKGWCLYNSSFHKETSNETYDILGENAAHALLPVGTKIKLTKMDNNKTIDILINPYLQPDNEILLQLSKEIAAAFGVEDGDKFECSISLHHPEPNYSSLKKMIGVSASFFVVVLIVMSFL